ncbi:lymphatic vessel endothelial hyaluronic receptor 1b isoform X2 [Antennarius striatus]|uniref:lymphatic vessel endothelial hyaluronic receptor 1b isoform X2 n=1 Tax=Antennarius striatus TaxID=241820 RepID=UPI0035B046C9
MTELHAHISHNAPHPWWVGTCCLCLNRFGWVSEQIAVVPRQTPDRNCGSGKTGAVSWAASPDRKFGAFCFSASDSGSTAGPSPTTAPTKSGPPSAGGPRTTEAPEQTSLTSGSVATPSAPPPHFTPLPHLFTPTPAAASTFLASFPDVSASSQSTNPKSASSSMSPLGEVPTALLILGSILLLLAAAGLVWFFRLRGTSSLWNQEQQMDDIETEMWKNSGSETDLHSQHGEEEEEELDRKYSSDVTLCVTSR